MNNQELMRKFPWLSDSEVAKLEKKPWLALYIEDDDGSLAEAVERHRVAQTEARIELRKKGKEPHKRMVVRGGIQTTAYEDLVEKEMK